MNLNFEFALGASYRSNSQRIRVLGEAWVRKWVYCPNCGNGRLQTYANSTPVADFLCSTCTEDYEVKCQAGALARKLADGAYGTMIRRLSSSANPSLIVVGYDRVGLSVRDLVIIPKYYFIPSIVEARKPLAATARRAGWQGCNILLSKIPDSGKIRIITDRNIRPKADVLADWRRILFLRQERPMERRKWLLAVMQCIEGLRKPKFNLSEVYKFEAALICMFPDNRNIRPKIRQQLQVLRDAGYLRFLGGGNYEIAQL